MVAASWGGWGGRVHPRGCFITGAEVGSVYWLQFWPLHCVSTQRWPRSWRAPLPGPGSSFFALSAREFNLPFLE